MAGQCRSHARDACSSRPACDPIRRQTTGHLPGCGRQRHRGCAAPRRAGGRRIAASAEQSATCVYPPVAANARCLGPRFVLGFVDDDCPKRVFWRDDAMLAPPRRLGSVTVGRLVARAVARAVGHGRRRVERAQVERVEVERLSRHVLVEEAAPLDDAGPVPEARGVPRLLVGATS